MTTLTLNSGSNIFQATPPVATGSSQGSTQNPYSIFSQNMVTMLKNAQVQTNQSNTALTGQRENLTNQSLNESNPSSNLPFSNLLQGMSGDAMLGSEQAVQGAFSPGIKSINDQIDLNNQALANATDIVNADTNQINAGKGRFATFTDMFGQVHTLDTATGQVDVNGSQSNSGGGNSTNGQPDLSSTGGVDFTGQATSTQPYALDPNYSKEVGGAYATIKQQMPQFDPTTADQYIDMQAPKSPVSGQMILTAANTYGVDPTLLMAQIQHESDFGTSGAAVDTMNPGNVGNTGSSTKSFNSWQAGVNATAYEDATRMPGNPNAKSGSSQPTVLTDPSGGQFSSQASKMVSSLPAPIQKFAVAGPEGVAYIPIDNVPTALQAAVQNYAAASGVKIFDTQDVTNIKALGVVYENVQKMQQLVTKDLSSGYGSSLLGGVIDTGKSLLNDATGQNAFPGLAAFNALRDVAIKSVQALAGGSGSGLRLTTGEIMASTATLADSGDSLQTANNKINGLISLLDTNLAANFPYTQGSQPGATGATPASGAAIGASNTVSNGVDLTQFNQ